MNVVLWIVQGILAALFVLVGSNHAFLPWEKLIKKLPALADLPRPFVRFQGTSELLAVVGLVVPGVMNPSLGHTWLPATLAPLRPWGTVAAAAGLSFEMLCAVIFHVRRKEYKAIALPAVLCALALFVAIGRWVMPV